MTGLKTFHVTVWDHSQFRATVRARSQLEALERARHLYAAASDPECEGFELVDNHGDDWNVSPAPRRGRKEGRP